MTRPTMYPVFFSSIPLSRMLSLLIDTLLSALVTFDNSRTPLKAYRLALGGSHSTVPRRFERD